MADTDMPAGGSGDNPTSGIQTLDRLEQPRGKRTNIEGEALDVCSAAFLLRKFHENVPPRAAWSYEAASSYAARLGWLIEKLNDDVESLAVAVWGEDHAQFGILFDPLWDEEPAGQEGAACEASQADAGALSPDHVATIRAALVAALEDSGAEVGEYGPEPGMSAHTLALEAQLRAALALLPGSAT